MSVCTCVYVCVCVCVCVYACGGGGGRLKPGNKTSFRSAMSPKTVAQEALEVRPEW